MSAIFISHSSRDDAVTVELKERLEDWGYGSVFLDFDPEAGIPPGRDWEQELYHQLKTCQAVLVLCSEHSMVSHWCFAEITHAKSLGKHVFPLRVADCVIHPVLAERQVLDLTADREAAYRRLERALKSILGEGFPWDEARPPYPGLRALQEEDAPVFFGRREEIQVGLESLERLRRYSAGGALLVLGASGSGKSSLVRAGLLPRLRRAGRDWLVVSPFRPLDRPWRELAIALATTFSRYGRERSWRELLSELERAAAAPIPSPDILIEVARDLRLAAGAEEAKVLLVIDQAEEILGHEIGGKEARFLPLMQAALASPQSPLMAAGTLRTDLLGEFQQHPATRDFRFDDLRVGPMTPEGLAEVIEGPARVAGVDLEDGLTEALLQDAETENALPLLAFALRELYERFGEDRRLTLDEYHDGLGGLGGSVAQAAESALASPSLSATDEKRFRDAMLSMVRIDDEGHYARRAVGHGNLPVEIHEVVDRFVEARLLVDRGEGRQRVVEVAHETLFRSWDRLRAWLDEDRELLLWRKRLNAARREWERTDRHPSLLLEGPALEEGRQWLDRRGAQLDSGERQFLQRSVRREALRRLRRMAAGGVVITLLALIAAGGLWLWRRAEDQRARAEDAAKVAVAADWMGSDPTRSAQVLSEVEDPESASFAVAYMREVIDHRLAELRLVGHTGAVEGAVFSPDGSRLVTVSRDQTARIWRIDASGEYIELPDHGDLLTAAVFSPGGDRVMTVAADGSLRIWPADGTRSPVKLENPTRVNASFGPRGDRVLAVASDGTARVWRLEDPANPIVLGDAEHFVLEAAFGPGGDRVVTVAQEGSVAYWRADRPSDRREITSAAEVLDFARLSPLGNRVLTVGESGAARVSRLDGPDDTIALEGVEGSVSMARFGPLGGKLLTVTWEGEVRVWDLEGEDGPWAIEGPSGQVVDAAFSPRGDHLALAYESGVARLWSWSEESPSEELRGHAGRVLNVAFSPRGDRAVTASEDGSARVWKMPAAKSSVSLQQHREPLIAAAFSPSGDRVLTASRDGTARLWPLEGGSPRVLDHGKKLILGAFDATGARVLTVSEDEVRVWPADGDGETLVIEQEDGIEAAALGPRGEWLSTVSRDGVVRLWRCDGAGDTVQLGSHEGSLFVSFSPSGERLVTTSQDGTVRVWPVDGTGEPVDLAGHGASVEKAFFSPDGELLVTASKDGTARVWAADGSDAPLILRGHAKAVRFASFSPGGRRLATASDDNTLRIWSLADPGEPIVLSRHTDSVTMASFSPDGRFVVSASKDGTALVWRADGDGEPLTLAGHADPKGRPARVTAAAFSPDGARVVTASVDSTARLWLISADGLRQTITAAVRGCLEPAFRRNHLGETLDEAQRAFRACRRQQWTAPEIEGDRRRRQPPEEKSGW